MIEVAMKRVDRVSRWGLQVENCWSVPIAVLAQAVGVDAVQRSSAPKRSHSRRVGCDFLGPMGRGWVGAKEFGKPEMAGLAWRMMPGRFRWRAAQRAERNRERAGSA